MSIQVQAASTIVLSDQPCLKINQFYVLYARPVVPYINKPGDVMAPVGELVQMLNATELEDFRHATITVTCGKRSIAFKAGSLFAVANGVSESISPAPILLEPAVPGAPTIRKPRELRSIPHLQWPLSSISDPDMIVPVAPLAAALGIECSWNVKLRVCQITDDDALSIPIAWQAVRSTVPWYQLPDDGVLIPVKCKIKDISDQRHDPVGTDYDLFVTVYNGGVKGVYNGSFISILRHCRKLPGMLLRSRKCRFGSCSRKEGQAILHGRSWTRLYQKCLVLQYVAYSSTVQEQASAFNFQPALTQYLALLCKTRDKIYGDKAMVAQANVTQRRA